MPNSVLQVIRHPSTPRKSAPPSLEYSKSDYPPDVTASQEIFRITYSASRNEQEYGVGFLQVDSLLAVKLGSPSFPLNGVSLHCKTADLPQALDEIRNLFGKTPFAAESGLSTNQLRGSHTSKSVPGEYQESADHLSVEGPFQRVIAIQHLRPFSPDLPENVRGTVARTVTFLEDTAEQYVNRFVNESLDDLSVLGGGTSTGFSSAAKNRQRTYSAADVIIGERAPHGSRFVVQARNREHFPLL